MLMCICTCIVFLDAIRPFKIKWRHGHQTDRVLDIYMCTETFFANQPARIAQLDRALELKTRGCGFDSRAGKSNNY